MSNIEAQPDEVECRNPVAEKPVEILTARKVPLGGPRAMTVRRTLPQRRRSFVGAWCFVDHYGPDDVSVGGGMDVPPHPHTGLQTVSWLFSGVVEHRDSDGVHALVRPGELNLMTGGNGICHSEVSTKDTTVLHGAQLWVALPYEHRAAPRAFRHYVPDLVSTPNADVKVFLGSLAGSTSPVETYTPLLGAEIALRPGISTVQVDPAFEHGVLLDEGAITVDGVPVEESELAYVAPGNQALTLVNIADRPARLLLLGGAPFDEEIVMWWNFVGRSHADIVGARDDWQTESGRFGRVEGYTGPVQRLPAPALPNAALKPRRNR